MKAWLQTGGGSAFVNRVAGLWRWVFRANRLAGLRLGARWFGRNRLAVAADGRVGSSPGRVARLLEAERARWRLWTPVLYGAGILVYFALPVEPTAWNLLALLPAAIGVRFVARRGGRAAGGGWGIWAAVLSSALLVGVLGTIAAKVRTEWVRAPVLGSEMPRALVAGWIAHKTAHRKGGSRVVLRVASIDGLTADRLPRYVRIVTAKPLVLRVGVPIALRVALKPPPDPVRPGGYDFARQVWFLGIGAVGFSVAKPEIATTIGRAPWRLRVRARIENLRLGISQRIVARLGNNPPASGDHGGTPGSARKGEYSGVVRALIVGERGGVPVELTEQLRASGLAHMLAISGLHMAVMAGSLFWLLRALAAAVPRFAAFHLAKKTAAVLALAGGAGYLLISGGAFATQRAFIMIGLMFVAMLLDRPAVSLRNVAMAALVILVLWPESVLEIGFQMSFAAATALVAFYESWSRRRPVVADGPLALRAVDGLRRIVLSTAGTTLIAGLAVAPLGVLHFHRLAQFSLLANLLAMPVFAFVVMPQALVSLLLMPFGWEGMSLDAMSAGISMISRVAAGVSELPGAVRHVAAVPAGTTGLIVLGGLWLSLWRANWRFLGLVPISAGLLLAGLPERADILVSRDGWLIAIRGEDGRLAALAGRVGRFALARWLEADGDPRPASEVRSTTVLACDRRGCTGVVRGLVIAVPRAPANLVEDCRYADIVITPLAAIGDCAGPRLVLDGPAIRAGGVIAVQVHGGQLDVTVGRTLRGARPWVRPLPVPTNSAVDGTAGGAAGGAASGAAG